MSQTRQLQYITFMFGIITMSTVQANGNVNQLVAQITPSNIIGQL
jgi:hypothetical protein